MGKRTHGEAGLDPTPQEQRIADLERELRLRDERIKELKAEVDERVESVRRLEQHIEEDREYLEHFIQSFGLTVNDAGEWTNSEFLNEGRQLLEAYDELGSRYNKLVGRFNRNIAAVQPVGRPIAASEAQQAQILKHHKAGRSSRWIAEELALSRRTVTTVIDKSDGTDRTSAKRRQHLGLEPKRKDWRDAARARLPKAATEHFEKGRKLLQEAKGLRSAPLGRR
jgi:hypothetical protein